MTTDDSGTVVDSLRPLGFTDHEARAYAALLARGPLTGYQLAKVSGIPRPNIYSVLDRLEQRGAVARTEAKRGTLHNALPAEAMLSRLSRDIDAQLAQAQRELAAIETAASAEYVWNVQGYEVMPARAEELIDGSEEQILVGLWSDESGRLAEAVARAQSRGVLISTLCIQGCPDECGGCRGTIYRYSLEAGTETRWLVIVADETRFLVGQVSEGGNCSAALTTLEVFAKMGAQYMRNAIAAAEIVRSLGPSLPDLLDDRARAAVHGAGLVAANKTWFEQMLEATGSTKP